MSRISSITLTEQPEQHVVSVRATIDFMKEFSDFCRQTFEKIEQHVKRMDRLVAGPPIVCFYNMDLPSLDVAVGFPVAAPVKGGDEIYTNTISAQKVASAIDLGPYEEQDPTLYDILAWIQTNGYEMKGEIYYHYLNDTERPGSEYLTRMVIPVQ